MKQKVMLSISGRQSYKDQEPEVIQLETEGEMEYVDGGWEIRYAESDLTGMTGTTTTFRVEPDKVILTREGALRSHMEFQMGLSHDSLYQMSFGALMITVTTKQLFYDIVPDGGTIDLAYEIEIEKTESGIIDYHIDIRAVDN